MRWCETCMSRCWFCSLLEAGALRSDPWHVCSVGQWQTAVTQKGSHCPGLENLHRLCWTLGRMLISWLDSTWKRILAAAYKIHSCPNKAKLLISGASVARGEMLVIAVTV